MAKFTLSILVSFLLSFGLQAQTLTGEWNVSGKNPEKVGYEGVLNVEQVNKTLHTLNWDVKYADQKKRQQFPGTGIYDPSSNVMYAAYGIETYRYGLVSYPLNDKGGIKGSGSWTSHKGIGSELLAGKLMRSEIAGTYQVVGRRSTGDMELGASETYEGTLKIKKGENGRYMLEWYLGDGTPYKGFAYKTKNALVGVWGIGGAFGLLTYTFDEDKATAKATWTSPNYDYMEGVEELEKK